jgi:integrase
MRQHAHAGVSLYGPTGSRKYLNAAERRRFIKEARRAPFDVQLFCLVLSLTGGRISEILALTPAAIDIDSGAANITTLKRSKPGIVRQVPSPCLCSLRPSRHLWRNVRLESKSGSSA